MNYNNYGYANAYPNQNPFNNYMQQPIPQQNMSMAVPPQQQPQPQQVQNELLVIMVDNEQAVQNYPVAMGNSVMLMDYQHKKFWIKSMSNGVTPTITEHEFKVISGGQPNSEPEVSREEFTTLQNSVNELKAFIEEFKS